MKIAFLQLIHNALWGGIAPSLMKIENTQQILLVEELVILSSFSNSDWIVDATNLFVHWSCFFNSH